jgi:hypothetical protein
MGKTNTEETPTTTETIVPAGEETPVEEKSDETPAEAESETPTEAESETPTEAESETSTEEPSETESSDEVVDFDTWRQHHGLDIESEEQMIELLKKAKEPKDDDLRQELAAIKAKLEGKETPVPKEDKAPTLPTFEQHLMQSVQKGFITAEEIKANQPILAAINDFLGQRDEIYRYAMSKAYGEIADFKKEREANLKAKRNNEYKSFNGEMSKIPGAKIPPKTDLDRFMADKPFLESYDMAYRYMLASDPEWFKRLGRNIEKTVTNKVKKLGFKNSPVSPQKKAVEKPRVNFRDYLLADGSINEAKLEKDYPFRDEKSRAIRANIRDAHLAHLQQGR